MSRILQGFWKAKWEKTGIGLKERRLSTCRPTNRMCGNQQWCPKTMYLEKNQTFLGQNLAWKYWKSLIAIMRSTSKPTKWPVLPAKTKISLGICPFWSVCTVCLKKFKLIRLIWVFTECTDNFALLCGALAYLNCVESHHDKTNKMTCALSGLRSACASFQSLGSQ